MGRNVTQQPIPYTPLVAGETLAAGDVISQYASDNKAYTSKYLPFATTANQGSAIYANTGLAISGTGTMYSRYPVIQATDGSIFTLEPNSANLSGLVIKKFTSTGIFLKSVVINTSATIFIQQNLILLSNGSIAAIVGNNSSQYAIVDQDLTVVKTLASSGQSNVTQSRLYSLASASGGFTIVTAYPALQNLSMVTINNTGTITTAATNIQTNFTSNGTVSAAMLSSGNIAIAFSSDTIASQYAVYTTAAVAVKAWTNLPSGVTSVHYTEIASVPGFFAVAYGVTSGVTTIAVFNNAGTQQGTQASPWSNPALANNGSSFVNKFTTDGTNFYWIAGGTVGLQTVKITTAGVLTAGPTSIGITGCAGLNSYWDAKTSSLVVVNFFSSTYTFFYISASSWSSTSSVNYYTLTLTNGGYGLGYQGIIAGSDGSMLLVDACSVLLAMYFGSIKPYNSSIIGVAAGAAASGATVSVNSAVGNYATTTATSTIGVKFNHSTAPILGAAGQVFPNTINIQTPTIRNIN